MEITDSTNRAELQIGDAKLTILEQAGVWLVTISDRNREVVSKGRTLGDAFSKAWDGWFQGK